MVVLKVCSITCTLLNVWFHPGLEYKPVFFNRGYTYIHFFILTVAMANFGFDDTGYLVDSRFNRQFCVTPNVVFANVHNFFKRDFLSSPLTFLGKLYTLI